MAAFVLGNGISRRHIEVDTLLKLGTVYGCNALYRTHTPHVLVATDRPIAEHIQHSGYPVEHKFYTRKPIDGLGALPVPKQYYGYSSGPIATGLAALDRHSTIYIIGFDMGPTTTKQFNNVYADTEFYRKSTAAPVYTGNWIKQMCQIAQDFSKTQFVRVQGPTTAAIQELDAVKNFSHLPMTTFVDRINNQKDL